MPPTRPTWARHWRADPSPKNTARDRSSRAFNNHRSFLYDRFMSANPDTSKVLSFEDARRVVEHEASLVRGGETETVELLASAGRVLAGTIVADRDIPPFPRST